MCENWKQELSKKNGKIMIYRARWLFKDHNLGRTKKLLGTNYFIPTIMMKMYSIQYTAGVGRGRVGGSTWRRNIENSFMKKATLGSCVATCNYLLRTCSFIKIMHFYGKRKLCNMMKAHFPL